MNNSFNNNENNSENSSFLQIVEGLKKTLNLGGQGTGKTVNFADAVSAINDTINNSFINLNKMNILIAGKTGVGKSTLLNAIFGEEIVEAGIGKPVTQEIKKIEKEGFPLTIYDTPGLELGGAHSKENLLNGIRSIIKEGIESGDISKAIHIILYCVNTKSARFEDAEADFVRQLSESATAYNVPVIVVLTQTLSKKKGAELKAVIENENLKVRNIIPVLAKDEEIDFENEIKRISSFGLEALAREIEAALPEAIKKTFAVIQRKSLSLKVKSAQKIVIASASAALATGAAPIPFSDAALLVPTEIAMIGSITACFGLKNFPKAAITALLAATIGSAGATVLGKTAVATLLKFIPGVGTVAGAVISGSTAAALTASLGNAYIAIMKKIYTGEIKQEDLATDEGISMIKQEFLQQLKIKRDKNGNPVE